MSVALRDRLRRLDPAGRALADTPVVPRTVGGPGWSDGPFALRVHTQYPHTPYGDVVLDPAAIEPAAVARIAKTPGVESHAIHRWVFLDTETTGLRGGAGTVAFLVGLGRFEDDRFVVRQYLMRDYPEEPAMIAAVADALQDAAVLVTYNGKSFDVPLLRDRFIMQRRPWPADGAVHLDLLHTVRRLWRPRLREASLGCAEWHLFGVQRTDDLPGADIPAQYLLAAREQNLDLLEPILAHNLTDILSLAALAVRVSEVGRDPLTAQAVEVEDLVHVGRSLETSADPVAASHAVACYTKAAQSDVSEAAAAAIWRLALMAKRRRDWAGAEQHWRRLVDADWPLAVAALEELAKMCEHRTQDLAAAETWCRRAQDRMGRVRHLHGAAKATHTWNARLAHRLTRLIRRRRRNTVSH